MTVAFTNAQALLVTMSNSLAAESTANGGATLATALTNLSTEINAATPTEAEFFTGGVAATWANLLNAAGQAVLTKGNNDLTTATITNEILSYVQVYEQLILNAGILGEQTVGLAPEEQQANARDKVKEIAGKVVTLIDDINSLV